MKKTRISLVIISLLLVCAMAVNLTGCTMEVQAKDLMEGITPNNVTALDNLSSQNADVTDFAIRLFKASEESGKNTLISPLSVLCALAKHASARIVLYDSADTELSESMDYYADRNR